MKKFLNTLYVTTQDVFLHKEGEALVADKNGETLMYLPIHTLQSIVVFGNTVVSPQLLELCSTNNVSVSFLSENGKFLARAVGPVSGNVLLRLAQFKAYESEAGKGEIARSFVLGKLMGVKNVLMRRIRDNGSTPKLEDAVSKIKDIIRRTKESEANVARLRGLEGEAGAVYFGAFNELIGDSHFEFYINSRNRRPPLDPMNALLSFLYCLLSCDCRGALEGVGLDPQIGFLHELKPGRPSLACDLMEEFRATLVDRTALSLVNRGQITIKDFSTSDSGAILLSDKARKTVLSAWQEKKKDIITHPFLDEKMQIGLLPHIQALLLARHLRGDMDAYPPYIPN